MYKIIGADQKEYGPVTADELRIWITEGRAAGTSLVRAEDGAWKPLSTFPEFSEALSVVRPPPALAPAATSGRPAATNTLAVAGLIMGLLSITVGLLCCGPLFGILGIIFSAVALSQIKRNSQPQAGRGMAIAGLVLSVFGLFLSLLILLAFGFWEQIVEAVKSRNR
jgi:hypothetical protein